MIPPDLCIYFHLGCVLLLFFIHVETLVDRGYVAAPAKF